MLGSIEDAERMLEQLSGQIADGSSTKRARRAAGPRTGRARRLGAVSSLAPDRWLVGVEGAADPVSGKRRRYTRVVRGSRDEAEVARSRRARMREPSAPPAICT